MNPKGVPPHFIQGPDGAYYHPSRFRREHGAAIPEPNPGKALVSSASSPEGSARKVRRCHAGERSGTRSAEGGSEAPVVRVTFIVRRAPGRATDEHDNLRASLKPLVDELAELFGVPDKDPRIRWEYGQTETAGPEGVIVLVEQI